jgi:hypothetical protein
VAGTQPLALQDAARSRADERFHFVGSVSDDNDRMNRLQCADGIEHVCEERLTRQFMQDLGSIGTHPIALARGKYHGSQRASVSASADFGCW